MAKRQMIHQPKPIFIAKDQIRQVNKVTLEVIVTGGSPQPIHWGDGGMAAMLDIAYTHPRHENAIQIRQAVRIRRDEPFTLQQGQRAELVCWGAMPSGMLQHPLFVRWLA